jgi:hypothetical protein
MRDEICIDGLKFLLTCGACPEQYDVYNGIRQQVGYVRLRGGWFRVDANQCGGETVYEHQFDDEWQGCFDDDEQRMKYLQLAADAIKKSVKSARLVARSR